MLNFVLDESVSVSLDLLALVSHLVLEVLDFLKMRGHISAVLLFSLLHLGVKVSNSSFKFFDFLSGVMIEVMNHVLFDLEHVTLDLGFVEGLLEVLLDGLKLLVAHGHVLVVGLLLLLTLLSLLAFASFLCGHTY